MAPDDRHEEGAPMKKTALSAMSAAAALAFAAPAAGDVAGDAAGDAHSVRSGPPGQVYAEYSGSVYFLTVARITLSAGFSETGYSAEAAFRSAGLLRWFDDTDIEATATGYINDHALEPLRYEHINHASNKDRLVGIDFDEGLAVPDINPPFGSMGDPPASDAERQGALDPISVILSLMTNMNGNAQNPCEGRLRVFDGKARYDLRFENAGPDSVRTRGWRGEAVLCHAFMEPVSGYDEGKRPTGEDTADPFRIWLAGIEGAWVPVRFRANTRIGAVTINATRVHAGDPA